MESALTAIGVIAYFTLNALAVYTINENKKKKKINKFQLSKIDSNKELNLKKKYILNFMFIFLKKKKKKKINRSKKSKFQ